MATVWIMESKLKERKFCELSIVLPNCIIWGFGPQQPVIAWCNQLFAFPKWGCSVFSLTRIVGLLLTSSLQFSLFYPLMFRGHLPLPHAGDSQSENLKGQIASWRLAEGNSHGEGYVSPPDHLNSFWCFCIFHTAKLPRNIEQPEPWHLICVLATSNRNQ